MSDECGLVTTEEVAPIALLSRKPKVDFLLFKGRMTCIGPEVVEARFLTGIHNKEILKV